MVVRHNRLGLRKGLRRPNSPGEDSSRKLRHFEIYSNSIFSIPRQSARRQRPFQHHHFIWIRGERASLDNNLDHLPVPVWRHQPRHTLEPRRGDDRSAGTARQHYPVPHQIGQKTTDRLTSLIPLVLGHNGATISFRLMGRGSCAFDWNTFSMGTRMATIPPQHFPS